MYEEGLTFVHLMGKAYLVTHSIATCYSGRGYMMELPGTVNPTYTSTLGLRGGWLTCPAPLTSLTHSRLRLMSELHVGHSMTYISTSISVTVVDYPPFLYLLNFLHFLAPTALQLPLYVALAMFLCCYKNVYVAQI